MKKGAIYTYLRVVSAACAHSLDSSLHFIGVCSQLMNGDFIIKLYI